MRNMYSSHDVSCVAAIYGLLQNTINTQSASVAVKYDSESTHDFVQRIVGTHSGMKVSCDLSVGTYIVVRGLSQKVHKYGFELNFGDDEYDVISCCVVSWKTNCGNYSTAHLYKLSDYPIDHSTMERCVCDGIL